ncbi:D-2-hydroxyacid dehydrogenase [Proteiniclasticum sp. BAD-10]|uniref:D-2-hydroxyacid dehydrogenase n=1 Tax=Proteiniclasticum sediminis TaxID=2804028 RepID=A0A941CNT3_9CLOT|nr:D-2-hydroxyacid dehydrogenase [Proteiniclasticum sediminis]MBR0576121.1 D-2-hydroxyacid dehydrogenase [Proteiniclasticum sediminis]
MKIVILDGYVENPGDLSWEGFEALGEVTVYDRTPEEAILARIGTAEVVYTNKTPLMGDLLRQCPQLKFIGVLATGYNVVDVKACSELGITVSNIPAYGTDAVAQFTMALLLELCHHVGDHSASVHAGEWTQSTDWCYWKSPLVELQGKTLGIVGYGRIGQRVGEIAQALGMKVLAQSRGKAGEADTPNLRFGDLDTLFRESDVLTLHCPLFPETAGLICRENLAKMKKGVFLLNTARGGLVVEEDLREALESGQVGGAAVDVVSVEPIRADNPLLGAKNMIITPHIAWAAKETRQRLMDIAVENLQAFVAGNPIHVVNSPGINAR